MIENYGLRIAEKDHAHIKEFTPIGHSDERSFKNSDEDDDDDYDQFDQPE